MRALTLGTTFLAALLLAASASAHEGHEHTAMGTVESLDDTQIVIVVADEGNESFAITEETKFTRGDDAVSADDVAAGERAVVIFETKDSAKVAKQVKLPPKSD